VTEDLEPVVATLVPVDPALIHAAPTDQVLAVQTAYHSLCEALLDENDYQVIDGKSFRKKSGWRKLAVAFNVSTELVKETEIRGQRNRIEEVKCIVRATAPNGRYMDGVGVCSVYEKCCDPSTCTRWERYPDSNKPTGHVHCTDLCNGRHHFSNPAHDLPSTAMTRATNRALADLFGMGEVSAEEITGDRAWETGEPTGGTDTRRSARRPSQPTEPTAPRMAVEAQLKRITQLRDELGDEATALFEEGFDPETLTFSKARAMIDILEIKRKAVPND
jgi:hypothetical protein